VTHHLVVTTSRRPAPKLIVEAGQWAQRLEAKAVPRGDCSLPTIAAQENVAGILVVGANRPIYYEPDRGIQYFFHPSMAKVRIHNIKSGRGDPMITAMGLADGDEVLDCTLGRGADAIVASWIVGPKGKVVGVEKVPLLAQLTIDGLQNYEIKPTDVAAALRRIQAHPADYNHYLPKSGTDSFDVVYFDPIFDEPLERSQDMAVLRALGDEEPVSVEAIEQALRVARRAVVIKQRAGTALWQQLPFSVQLTSGTTSRIEYGVISV